MLVGRAGWNRFVIGTMGGLCWEEWDIAGFGFGVGWSGSLFGWMSGFCWRGFEVWGLGLWFFGGGRRIGFDWWPSFFDWFFILTRWEKQGRWQRILSLRGWGSPSDSCVDIFSMTCFYKIQHAFPITPSCALDIPLMHVRDRPRRNRKRTARY